MPGLSDTIPQLARLRRSQSDMLASLAANFAEPLRLKLIAPSGTNPGELRMLAYVPPGLPPGAPLVTVLHGCTQNAAAYDHGSGWSTLAERHGFALLFPEQQRSNNANLCFNWFQPDDITAGHGEVESIRQMVLQMIATHRLDPRRSFITGLSAGGAMAAAMLATAPTLFAAAAIIAGLPYGAATNVMDAFSAMSHPHPISPAEWGAKIRAASTHPGPWPALQVWQGTADNTVTPANAAALVAQWTNVMGLPLMPTASTQLDGARHDTWSVGPHTPLEQFIVPALAHGTPIDPTHADADHAVGIPGPHMLAAPISSTYHIARSWGLLTQPSQPSLSAPRPASLIDRALKAAGLKPT